METKLLKKFQEYCKDKTIAIVGNSSCIFNKSYGAKIDKHDIVIRFNWIIEKDLKRFATHTGQKFNVYVYAIKSPGRFQSLISRNNIKNKDFIIRTRHDDSHYLSEKATKNILYYCDKEFRDSIPLHLFTRCKEASAGAMTLQFLLDCVDFKSISLFGFDFFKSADSKPSMSNEFRSFYFMSHNKKDEKDFFDYWISEYKGTDKIKFYD